MALRAFIPQGLVLAVACIGMCASHICIIHPVQRGGFNITTPGDPSCYRRTGYCGETTPAMPTSRAAFKAGSEVEIKFEQNLNHWYPPNPGYFDVAVSYNTENPSDEDWITLKKFDDFPAFEMVMQTVFTITVTMPQKEARHAILRMRYVSHNPDEIDPKTNTESIFYNCADISLTSSSALNKQDSMPNRDTNSVDFQKKYSPISKGYSCKTPPVWAAIFKEENMWGTVQHAVYWDQSTLFTRWDKSGHLDGSGESKTMSMINDYNKPVEYVNFKTPPPARCPIYGNDKFYNWVYDTETTKMVHKGRMQNGDDEWVGGDGMYTWTTRDLGDGLCKPTGWARGESKVELVTFASGSITPGVFTPDAICTKNPTFGGCHNVSALMI